MTRLNARMSAKQFDGGYFYASELRDFARSVGITVGNRRKIELEQTIRDFLETGAVATVGPRPNRIAGQPRDTLTHDSVVQNYVDDRKTKSFLLSIAFGNQVPAKNKSGQWYWLNDWRRNQQAAGQEISYGQLAQRLRELMETAGRLPQIASARMNNFKTDFRADPGNAGSSHKDVTAAWQWIKENPGPKTYAAYKRAKAGL